MISMHYNNNAPLWIMIRPTLFLLFVLERLVYQLITKMFLLVIIHEGKEFGGNVLYTRLTNSYLGVIFCRWYKSIDSGFLPISLFRFSIHNGCTNSLNIYFSYGAILICHLTVIQTKKQKKKQKHEKLYIFDCVVVRG